MTIRGSPAPLTSPARYYVRAVGGLQRGAGCLKATSTLTRESRDAGRNQQVRQGTFKCHFRQIKSAPNIGSDSRRMPECFPFQTKNFYFPPRIQLCGIMKPVKTDESQMWLVVEA